MFGTLSFNATIEQSFVHTESTLIQTYLIFHYDETKLQCRLRCVDRKAFGQFDIH